MLKIKGFQKTSLIDYPDKISSIIFLPFCNLKCGYCHNPELLINPENIPSISEIEVLKHLKENKKLLDGIVITGGEPTLHKELPNFIRKVKEKGFMVKLDTNGTNPKMLQELIQERLIDFIAMDIKNIAPKYKKTVNTRINFSKIMESIRLVIQSGIEHEFRTTVLPELHTNEDLIQIAKEHLKGAKKYVIQQFLPAEKLLDIEFKNAKKFTSDELKRIKEECEKFIKTEVRNI